MPRQIRLAQPEQIAFIRHRINEWVAQIRAAVTKKISHLTRALKIDYLTPPYRLADTQMHAVLILIAFLISTLVVVVVAVLQQRHDNAKPQSHLLKIFRTLTNHHYLRKKKLVVVVLIAS